MIEEQINKRIKELQHDNTLTFKLTEDVISIVYRTALDDFTSTMQESLKDEVKDNKTKVKFGTKNKSDENINNVIQKTKRDTCYDILNYIESKNDLLSVYIYVKEKCKEYGEPGVQNKSNNRERKRENPWM